MNKTVKVTLTTKYNNGGVPSLVSARPVIRAVQHHYLSGKVCDSSGSVWDVVLNPNQQESNYITVG